MEPVEEKSARCELPEIGAVTGLRGAHVLWSFFESCLVPLGFKKKSVGFVTAEFTGERSGHEVSVKLFHRRQSRYFGSRDHMSRLRIFQGLDLSVSIPVELSTRAVIGTRIGGNGLLRKFLLWLVGRKGSHLITCNHPLFGKMDIFAHDEIWMKHFLADPVALDSMQDLTNEAMLLVSWSVKFTPGKMVVNRRLSSLESITAESLDKQFNQIVSLAEVAESKPVSKEIKPTGMERLQKQSPAGAAALAGLYLLGLIIVGFTLLIGIPFSLIIWLR